MTLCELVEAIPIASSTPRNWGYIFFPERDLGSISQHPQENSQAPWPLTDHIGVVPGISFLEARRCPGKKEPLSQALCSGVPVGFVPGVGATHGEVNSGDYREK